MSDRAWDMVDFRKLMGFGRGGLNEMLDIRDAMKESMLPFIQSVIKDKGYSQEYKNLLGSDTMGTLRQAKLSDEDEISKQVAGLGMTNTGLALRNKQELGDRYRKTIADARRGLDIGSREELWRGIGAMGDLSQTMFDMSATREGLKQQKDANSFMGSLKRGFGSALGGAVFGGGGSHGYRSV